MPISSIICNSNKSILDNKVLNNDTKKNLNLNKSYFNNTNKFDSIGSDNTDNDCVDNLEENYRINTIQIIESINANSPDNNDDINTIAEKNDGELLNTNNKINQKDISVKPNLFSKAIKTSSHFYLTTLNSNYNTNESMGINITNMNNMNNNLKSNTLTIDNINLNLNTINTYNSLNTINTLNSLNTLNSINNNNVNNENNNNNNNLLNTVERKHYRNQHSYIDTIKGAIGMSSLNSIKLNKNSIESLESLLEEHKSFNKTKEKEKLKEKINEKINKSRIHKKFKSLTYIPFLTEADKIPIYVQRVIKKFPINELNNINQNKQTIKTIKKHTSQEKYDTGKFTLPLVTQLQ